MNNRAVVAQLPQALAERAYRPFARASDLLTPSPVPLGRGPRGGFGDIPAGSASPMRSSLSRVLHWNAGGE